MGKWECPYVHSGSRADADSVILRMTVVFKKPDGPKRKRCSYDDVKLPEVKRLNVADSELKLEKGDIAADTKEEKKKAGNDNDKFLNLLNSQKLQKRK